MTGADFGSFLIGLIVVAIVVAIGVWLLHCLYLRSSKERAFVRTGLGEQKVVLDGGAFVLPIVHDVIPVNMNTLRLEVVRGRDKALITKAGCPSCSRCPAHPAWKPPAPSSTWAPASTA